MIKTTRFFLLVFTVITFAGKISAQCNCWVKRDASFSVAPFSGYTPPLYQNDDGSTPAIAIPFTYCFFGISETSLYINNNGNISFGVPYTAFTPLTFPVASYSLLAPFWADVDTRLAPSGVVYYKVTPTYIIVQWDSVGYYNEHTDKLNSFEVIISNGHDPIVPYGNNTEFCYGLMQWTTGDASGGVNGFGGTPAIVGANKGDGVNSLQYGLFGQAGATYTGPVPVAPYDGVGWLDNKAFIFNACSVTVPPTVSGVSSCDTIQVCIGDTTLLHILFFSSKPALTTHSALSPPIPSGVSIINNWPGNVDSLTLRIIGTGANYGFHTVNLYGYDNAVPHDTTWVSFVLEVDSSATGTLVLRKDTICPGSSTSLRATCNVNKYLWSTGSTKDSIIVSPAVTTTYTVTLGTGTCALHLSKTVVVEAALNVKIDTVCTGKKAIADLKDTKDSGVSTYFYTGTVQSFTVPAGVTTLTVTVVGAAGGGPAGGFGADFAGSCAVTPGHVLSIVVGQQGGLSNADGGGGGGGSYVWDNANTTTPLAIAGGGGGEYWTGAYAGGVGGTNVVTHACPVGAGTAGHGADGAAGAGGTGGPTGTGPGAAGAGWLSNGGSVAGTYPCTGGKDRANAFAGGPGYSGGSPGGYGGGGGGGYDAGAGGGGYNGGGGANDGTGNGGDGGGSYLTGALIGVAGDTGAGSGYVSIKYNSFMVGGVAPYTYLWSPSGGTRDTAAGLSNGTYTVTVKDKIGCTASASVVFNCPVVLPVELLSFNAVYDNSGNLVNLNWASATETNNAYYTVERSQDGIIFTKVTTVAGAGNSDEVKNYAAVDPDILGGIVYYRLKQTDYDGNYSYSQVDAVNEGEPADVLIIPNPASLSVNVEYKAASAGEREVVRMYDCTGRLVIGDKTIISEQGINSVMLDISGLSKGVYVIRVDSPYKTYYKKCIKD